MNTLERHMVYIYRNIYQIQGNLTHVIFGHGDFHFCVCVCLLSSLFMTSPLILNLVFKLIEKDVIL